MATKQRNQHDAAGAPDRSAPPRRPTGAGNGMVQANQDSGQDREAAAEHGVSNGQDGAGVGFLRSDGSHNLSSRPCFCSDDLVQNWESLEFEECQS